MLRKLSPNSKMRPTEWLQLPAYTAMHMLRMSLVICRHPNTSRDFAKTSQVLLAPPFSSFAVRMTSDAFIQPIGLIVNEMVMNAAKHGVPPITVSHHEQSGMVELAVSDRGKGLPEDFDVAQSIDGIGMRVVRALAAQLGGQLHASNAEGNKGARFSVQFPATSRSGLHY